ncbi:MAG TPA: GntG family PLP-dependent aldolase [Anaeromyxobacter sp.]|nr:GntG family PLP-dependent aldolase [Anaeromyxobacter sp.]
MKTIDLRSDTVTRPSPGMREAIARAEVGDDVFGEDPTVRELEERVAALLGKEQGLFVPSGTMANQIALGTLARPGEEVLCHEGAHVLSFEGAAPAALWGIQLRALPGERGILSAADVEGAIRPEADWFPRTRAVEIENTHNGAGGSVWPLERVREIGRVAASHGLEVYLDGARLMNACAASGVAARDYAAPATMASICLSKGLGAPAGSVLTGPSERIREARRLRKRLGGGMRQAGILAAAGIYALDHNVARLSEDHANARRLAAGMGKLPGFKVAFAPESNLVYFRLTGVPAAQAADRLRARLVLCAVAGPDLLRFATHLDASTEDVEEAIRRAAEAFR